MDNLKRNPAAIKAVLYEKDGKWYTKEKISIEFPKWYEEKNLLTNEAVSRLYGIFAFVLGDQYSVSLIPTPIVTKPLMIEEIERGDETYYSFLYAKNTVVIESTKVVCEKLLSYNMFNSFFILNKLPWFLEYEDKLKVLDNLKYYGKSEIGSNPIANEIIVSFCERNAKDPNVFYRQNQTGGSVSIDLKDPYYAARNTVNRIGGSYYAEGLNSAIVQKEEAPSKIEKLVRQ